MTHLPDSDLRELEGRVGPQKQENVMTEDQIKHMVNRFLMWRLPEHFRPDAGISFKPDYNQHTAHPMKHEPVGTNLFDATQADEMVRYMIDGLPAAPPKSLAEKVREAAKRPVPDDTMPQRPAKAAALPSLIADLRKARERVGETAGVLVRLERAVTHHQHKRTLNDGRATAARELTKARIALDDALEEARARIKELEER